MHNKSIFIGNAALILAAAVTSPLAFASPSQTGQSGFIQMPSGRIEKDGTLQFGLSTEPIYQAIWANVAFLPWLEISGRFTRIDDVNGGLGEAYGSYKDKSFDTKIRLLDEGKYWPSVVFGSQDFHGTRLFGAQYFAAAKRFGPLDLTVGYGEDRIDGWFGGARYDISALPGLSLTAEYNAFDYKRDHAADQSGAKAREKGVGVGVDYRWGWLGTQLSWQDDRWGMLGYVSVPLAEGDFIPKTDEPEPYQSTQSRPTEAQWQTDPEFKKRLAVALRAQDFHDVGIDYREKTLRLRVTSTRIAHMARAVGRVARTGLALGPVEQEKIEIVYTRAGMPVATIHFDDVYTLNAFYQNLIGGQELMSSVRIRHADPTVDGDHFEEAEQLLAGLHEGPRLELSRDSGGGHFFSVQGKQTKWYDAIGIAPKVGFFFNDPSGALHYELMLDAGIAKQLRKGMFFDALVSYTLLTDMDEITQQSNSQLPHVRSDIARYRQGSDWKLTRLVLSQVWPVRERLYARVGAGLYEEMFGGAGVQALYVLPNNKFAVDIAVDAVRQRDFSEPLKFQDYKTVTSIASLHARLPYNVTATIRAGEFLAKDEGFRFELKRRFKSGYEIGGWYSHTNANDIMTPGSPDKPYQDKGIYFSVPLNTLLTKDTPSESRYSLRPWSRDGGQLPGSPLELYNVLEKPLMLDYPDFEQKFERIGNR